MLKPFALAQAGGSGAFAESLVNTGQSEEVALNPMHPVEKMLRPCFGIVARFTGHELQVGGSAIESPRLALAPVCRSGIAPLPAP
jgi:hypothetical protein